MKRSVNVDLVINQLDKYLTYDETTGHFYRNRKRAGSLHSDGYRYLGLKGISYPEHYLVWLCEMRVMPPQGFIIDHKDRVKSNNKFDNLRLATPSQNNVNAKIRKDNTLSLRGVYFNKEVKKFRAFVWKNGKYHSCGYFKTSTEAKEAANKRRKELYGEFAEAC